MNLNNLRFGGFNIASEGDYQRAMAHINSELKERLPDKESAQGYLPSASFKEQASKFSEDFSRYAQGVRTKAVDGSPVSKAEFAVLEKGEILHLRATAGSLRQADEREKSFTAGKNPIYPGSTNTETVRRILSKRGEDSAASFGHEGVRFRL